MKKMSSAKHFLVAVAAVVLLFSVCEVSGDDSVPSKCDDPPCQQLPPPNPPFYGYPSYGTPPPPSPADYSIYGAPPPPLKDPGHKKCPPVAPQVQCCTPPYPYYTYAPPNPYTYVPYGEGGTGRLLVPILAPLIMMIFSAFMFLF